MSFILKGLTDSKSSVHSENGLAIHPRFSLVISWISLSNQFTCDWNMVIQVKSYIILYISIGIFPYPSVKN